MILDKSKQHCTDAQKDEQMNGIFLHRLVVVETLRFNVGCLLAQRTLAGGRLQHRYHFTHVDPHAVPYPLRHPGLKSFKGPRGFVPHCIAGNIRRAIRIVAVRAGRYGLRSIFEGCTVAKVTTLANADDRGGGLDVGRESHGANNYKNHQVMDHWNLTDGALKRLNEITIRKYDYFVTKSGTPFTWKLSFFG